MNWDDIGNGLLLAGMFTGMTLGLLTGVSFAVTRDPLAWSKLPQNANAPCGEGIHVTHNSQPIVNLAIKQLGTGVYTWAITNSTGYAVLSICSSVTVIVTFQATDYAFQLKPHQIIEAAI